jgi:transcriptional regulator with XRE-family HTH domain
MSEALERVGRKIAFERVTRNVSQDELALRIGCNKSTVSRIESAKQSLSVEVLLQIGEALGVQPHQFLL